MGKANKFLPENIENTLFSI